MTFEEMVTRALYDEGFRTALKKNPAETLRAYGVDATPALVKAVQGVNLTALNAVANEFSQIKPFAC